MLGINFGSVIESINESIKIFYSKYIPLNIDSFRGKKIVAFAHYRRMPSPLRGKDIGFLDDLFVKPEFRGLKIGEQIISKLKTISMDKGWGLVRWITRSDNLRAKSLYDRVSKKTNWEVYEL